MEIGILLIIVLFIIWFSVTKKADKNNSKDVNEFDRKVLKTIENSVDHTFDIANLNFNRIKKKYIQNFYS